MAISSTATDERLPKVRGRRGSKERGYGRAPAVRFSHTLPPHDAATPGSPRTTRLEIPRASTADGASGSGLEVALVLEELGVAASCGGRATEEDEPLASPLRPHPVIRLELRARSRTRPRHGPPAGAGR